jgi:hypothetical protein
MGSERPIFDLHHSMVEDDPKAVEDDSTGDLD